MEVGKQVLTGNGEWGQGTGRGAGVAAPRQTGHAPYEAETPDLGI